MNGAIQIVRETLHAIRATCPDCRTQEQAPPHGYACHKHRYLFARARDLLDVDREVIRSVRKAARAVLADCPPTPEMVALQEAIDHLDGLTIGTTYADPSG